MTRIILLLSLAAAVIAAELPESIHQWWANTQALSNDAMEGRDTGSAGYQRAAAFVVQKFKEAGLQPAGSNGFYQPVPLHEVRLMKDESSAHVTGPDGPRNLEWLRDISVGAALKMPASVKGNLVFFGSDADGVDAKDKIVVRLRTSARSGANARPNQPEGAAAVISIDSTGGPEPPRWPVAYAVTMRLKDDPLPQAPKVPTFRLNPASADKLLAGSGHTYAELKALADSGKPLPSFEIPATFEAKMKFTTRDLVSDNIIATLKGTDEQLAKQYVAVSAHLDGYGFGEPWNGDRIYNGTFDDAAYVATLIDLANELNHAENRPKRSVLFCVFTGEEKGLLGSKYFTTHLPVRQTELAADINLDQLRPIFPLRTLTTLAINDSSLGEDAKQVASQMGIRLQTDPEPERNLLRRSDHWNFMQIGVPSTGFIFGYQNGSPEEAVYRRWYAERYHSPADDLNQPWDPAAAAKFNQFFDRLVMKVADDPERPSWSPNSQFAHAPAN